MTCRACTFVYVLDPPTVEYDEHYLYGDQVVTGRDPVELLKADGRLNAIGKFVKPRASTTFLDIGIGDGLLLSRAKARGYQPFGYDINESGFAVARQLYHLDACFESGDLANAFQGQKFNVIHMNEVIEHLVDPLETLRWCADRLDPGGLLVVQTGNVTSLVAWLSGSKWPYIKAAHVGYYSPRTLLFALGLAGFRPVRQKTIDWGFTGAFRTAMQLARSGRRRAAVQLLAISVTAQVPNVRRSIVVYGMHD